MTLELKVGPVSHCPLAWWQVLQGPLHGHGGQATAVRAASGQEVPGNQMETTFRAARQRERKNEGKTWTRTYLRFHSKLSFLITWKNINTKEDSNKPQNGIALLPTREIVGCRLVLPKFDAYHNHRGILLEIQIIVLQVPEEAWNCQIQWKTMKIF